MDAGMYIEEALLDVLKETDLLYYERKLCVELQLSRLEHFDHITDAELKSYVGLSLPAIRRLRQAIAEKKKKAKKGRGIFSTIGKKESREIAKMVATTSMSAATAVPATSKGATCLIPKDQVKLMERLGEGSFAVVKRGIWSRSDGEKVDVAVKVLRDSSPEIIDDLQQEVNNMQKLQHPNLIRLFGVIFANPAMMVVEFCEGGSLVDRLRSTEKPVPLISMLLDYAQQIAKGMAYLESKHCVHRDLAARNVLLTDNEKTAKICDFGLTRALEDNERLYVMSAQKKIPFAWCPPESLRFRQFSHASDVWAFGVTLWELFSYGEEPWAGFRGAEVLSKLEASDRLPKPRRCSAELFDLISTCWSANVNMRPRFSLLKGILADIKFMIAECREPTTINGDIDLELKINDRVIVVDGSGVIWYGQNVRTRNFGSFPRSSIHAKSERSSTSVGVLSPVQPKVDGSERISRPIPGSFIHAGHGDITPGQSWGQPERIDDIYLKNPILRKEHDLKENEPRTLGPQFIPSVIDMQPLPFSSSRLQKSEEMPAKKSKPALPSKPLVSQVQGDHMAPSSSNERTVYSPSTIDPFAPFSEYYCDAFDENKFDDSWIPPSSDSGVSARPASFVRNSYDEPPRSTLSDVSHSRFASSVNNDSAERSWTPPASPSTQATKAASSALLTGISNELEAKTLRPHVVEKSSSSETQVSVTRPTSRPSESGPSSVVPRPTSQLMGSGSSKHQYASLPRPQRSSPDLPSVNGVVSGRQPPGATPPPIRASNFVEQHSASAVNLRTPLGGLAAPPMSLSSLSTLPSAGEHTTAMNQDSLDKTLKAQTASTSSGAEAATKTEGNTFRTSSYYAALGRKAQGAAKQNSDLSRNDPIHKPSAASSQLQSGCGASALPFAANTKETVFGVNPPAFSANSSGSNIAANELTSSPLASMAPLPQKTPPPGSVVQSMNSAAALVATAVASSVIGCDGSDPFEVSSSVKNIASRGRYRDAFTESSVKLPSASSGMSSSKVPSVSPTLTTAWKPSSVLSPKSMADLSGMSRVSWFPSSSSLPHENVGSSSADVVLSSVPPASSRTMTPLANVAGGSLVASSSSSSLPSSRGTDAGTLGKAQLRSSSSLAGPSSSFCAQPSQSTTYVLGQPTPNQMYHPSQQRVIDQRDSTPIMTGYAPAGYALSGPSTSAASAGIASSTFVTPYYWSPGQVSSGLTASHTAANCNNRPAFVYDANLSNVNRNSGASSLLSLSIARPKLDVTPAERTGSRPQSTLVDAEILGLFDPLAPSSSMPNKALKSGSGGQPSAVDPVDAVLKEAIFAGREKCALMLKRCNNDVNKAIRELKANELLAMGIASDKAHAVTALEDCHWDLNAAAAALIT